VAVKEAPRDFVEVFVLLAEGSGLDRVAVAVCVGCAGSVNVLEAEDPRLAVPEREGDFEGDLDGDLEPDRDGLAGMEPKYSTLNDVMPQLSPEIDSSPFTPSEKASK